jgi:GNAT superfamily N-acetyltransferase
MMWKVRALLNDRPGAMAALAVTCGDRAVNILSLEIFPAADGRVVDELILHSPDGWTAAHITELCTHAGIADPFVAECSPHVLEDQPVRYLRAAGAVAERPELLEDQLCLLLDASVTDGQPGAYTMVLGDEGGPEVRLSRAVAFTDTEVARATELRRLVRPALPSAVPAERTEPVHPGTVAVRRGSVDDVGALIAMHDRCSAETVLRRYHAPVPRMSPRLARALLEPVDGLSLLATSGDQVVAAGVLATGPVGSEVGLMVEDRWQRQGLGTRLLRGLAEEAARRGLTRLVCLVQPENNAVLSTVRRAGLRAHVSWVDGMTQCEIPVAKLTDPSRRRSSLRTMGQVTTPLVALLHARAELREVYAPADYIDRAVRDGV